MPQQVATQVDNQFIQGLVTEFTGLNFPDKACIDTDNCVFDKTGLVSRRFGINYEANFDIEFKDRAGKALSTYYWQNVTGDGTVFLYVVQVGSDLMFYDASAATTSNPISDQKLEPEIDLLDFV